MYRYTYRPHYDIGAIRTTAGSGYIAWYAAGPPVVRFWTRYLLDTGSIPAIYKQS